MSEQTPSHLGKYEIIREIGRGGFAVVYLARDTTLDRTVALKVLAPHLTWDPSFVSRFEAEARTVARLRHPNIVTLYETGSENGQLYLAMEHLEGRTLAQVIADQGPLPLERTVEILSQVADALDYAHRQGVLHRDVKPANIMVEEDDQARLHVTLMDFGLVKAIEGSQSLTSHGTMLGSPEYMAPEQADVDRRDEIGPATDLYALGVVAYEMLIGRVPFPGSTPATLVAHMQKPPPSPQSLRADLPNAVASMLLKALSKLPGDRYPTAGAFVDALRGVDRPAKMPRREKNRSAMWLLGGVVLVALVLLSLGAWLGSVIASRPTPIAAAQRTPPTATLVASMIWTNTPEPLPTTTHTPKPSNTPTDEPTATQTTMLTHTPRPTSTFTLEPTATSTETPLPSATPTKTPRSTATFTPTATPTPYVEIQVETANVRSGPGTVYPVVGQVKKGDRLRLLARTQNSDWWQVSYGDGEVWISANVANPSQEITQIAVTSVIPPTPIPTRSGRIAFVCSGENSDICVVNVDGSNLVNLTNHPARDSSPSWSPDGRRIAFVSDRTGHSEIYAMNVDGSGVTRLTDLSNAPDGAVYWGDGSPSWSPDSSKIAFTRSGYRSEIYVVNADGSGLTKLTDRSVCNTGTCAEWDESPAWSPIDQRIAFRANRDGDYELYLVNADGSGEVIRLTDLSGHVASPAWLPDGQQIAFFIYENRDSKSYIYVINVDSLEVVRIWDHLSLYYYNPLCWSSDGKWVAFSQGSSVYVMNADGSAVTRLTDGSSPTCGP